MAKALTPRSAQAEIRIRGASEHNLKGVNLTIPRGTLTTMTGVSGSGKSSLAFDTIYKEGQRRFVESLSSYARQFLGQGEKPRVEHIEGLSPTVSVDQKSVNRNPRSTVGTITEIHDHLRLLFARLGTPHCPKCDKPIHAQSPDQVVQRVLRNFDGERVMVMAPIIKDRKGEYRKELKDLLTQGFVRARIDGEVCRLDEPMTLKRYERHTIEVILDRVVVEAGKASRVAEAVEQAFRLGKGLMSIAAGGREESYSAALSCIDCGIDVPELEPRSFSFNSPHGACPRCDGLGEARGVDLSLVVPDETLTVDGGALAPMRQAGFSLRNRLGVRLLSQVCDALKIPRDKPFGELTERQRQVLLYGDPKRLIDLDLSFEGKRLKVKRLERRAFEGVVPILEEAYADRPRASLERYMGVAPCRACKGSRLKPEALAVRFRECNIQQLGAMPIAELARFVAEASLLGAEAEIGGRLMKELAKRLEFLDRVGLGYLTVDRSAATLSGGESQRIRLATQVGSQLRGILYVLDEPSIGLHQRDNRKLIETLIELRDAGNTVLVVEHDQETIEASDFVVDVGPGAGALGGRIVACGRPDEVARNPDSVTGAFLRGTDAIAAPTSRRVPSGGYLKIDGARAHNLKNVSVAFPVGLFSCVTGVSGSGKSTLVDGILKRVLAKHFHGAEVTPLLHRRVTGLELLDKVIEIDQSPIGRTPRSNPGTYTKVFDLIRDLFASLPESKARGYQKGRFSFNVKGGRCDECQGAGVKLVEMHFLADVTIPCEFCGGHRFNTETLEVRYRGKSINDVLQMTISEALVFFANHKKILRVLETLERVGLGYLSLGQQSTTLSGGEAQRVKLASELHRPATGRTLYILDEPTTGLHFIDIKRLLLALQALVDAGNTVVVIEHNLDVVKCADWVIDMGPEGGSGGGEVLFSGPLDGLLSEERSHTGRMLKELLQRKKVKKQSKKPRPVHDRALDGDIRVFGAAMHNLKKVDVRFPAGMMTVVTGLSGSGKTSLAFDTLFSEGQRRFVECLSTYARQFLGRMERPPLDRIEGLAPAIAIDQKNAGRSPRSTVATTTEIHDYLRILYARLGVPHCPTCGKEATAAPAGVAFERLLKEHRNEKGMLLAPLYIKESSLHTALKDPERLHHLVPELREEGFVRVLVDGKVVRLDEPLPKTKAARDICLVVDRIQWKESARTRLIDSIGLAYRHGLQVLAFERENGERAYMSELPGCPQHGFILEEELVPRMFSFNSHQGACSECTGLGVRMTCDPKRLIADPSRPIFDGGLIDRPGDFIARGDGYFRSAIEQLCAHLGSSVQLPFRALPKAVQEAILFGYDGDLPLKHQSSREDREVAYEMNVRWKGLCRYVEEWRGTATSDWWLLQLNKVMREDVCAACQGERLKPEFRAVTVAGVSLPTVGRMTVTEAMAWVTSLVFEGAALTLAAPVCKELLHRLGFLSSVGLEYLQLERSAATLSGGEAQRIRLATQIGNRLTGVIYVLDEPTVGLHPRDTARLLQTLKELRDLGNTLVVVEHDRDTIDQADWIIDMGPGAGREGGSVVFQGSQKELGKATGLTAEYLLHRRSALRRPKGPRRPKGRILLEGMQRNNLRDLTVEIPTGVMVSVTGVSGSGKSTLVMDILGPSVEALIRGDRLPDGVRTVQGAEGFVQCITVDQAPLGVSPRSNPASYIEIFDHIRTIMASAPTAKMRGYKPGRFSFNTAEGRCQACEGRGSIKVEMHFLPDVWITCEECKGRRFNRETLSVEYRGKTISDILEMEVVEAVDFFANHPRVRRPVELLRDVGLSYMQLGQSATTLSGGEAQRVKLARELGRRTSGQVLYILDEPTTGLHFEDVARLTEVLQRLVELGHTVVLIEHNLDVIASSDHVIDLGPEGGAGGGRLVVTGRPEEIIECDRSHTGRALSTTLGREHANRSEHVGIELAK
jgi:excinuclease ABC subunit A